MQYSSAHSAAWVIASTRNGIEENPLTKQKLYYNGGSSIWDPSSRKLAQAPVLPPEVLPSGVHGVAMADITPAASSAVRAALLCTLLAGDVRFAGGAPRADRRCRHGDAAHSEVAG